MTDTPKTETWHDGAVFYHIYPLGFCGSEGLQKIIDQVPHIKDLGCEAVYLGPVFASSKHGYDTADYFRIDPRLGTESDFIRLADSLHAAGIRIVLDGVFNHVGRDFWAFKKLLEEGSESQYRDWFCDVDFSEKSPYGDPFSYKGWEGHFDLVTLNLHHAPLREHLFQAVDWMIDVLGIDGLRLDVAYCLPDWFLRDLRMHVNQKKKDFYLLGEVIHGNYAEYLGADMLDSVTNYECYKGLWSSLNDANYFEIAYSLKRQFGTEGISKGYHLYSFVENHDVDRAASLLNTQAHLYPLYGMLMTMPGSPAIYYGGELAAGGIKTNGDDSPLRPAWSDLPDINSLKVPDKGINLRNFIRELSAARKVCPALESGAYRELHVSHQAMAFLRIKDSDSPGQNSAAVAAFNASGDKVEMEITGVPGSMARSLLQDEGCIEIREGRMQLELPAYGTAVLQLFN
ncbi:alpha-amylase family glycosyl hydrolase [Spirochaeta dissipatitropha]